MIGMIISRGPNLTIVFRVCPIAGC
jgi:hypothetical protein